jgi:hypothetical protein
MGHSRDRGEGQRGQILVLFTLMIVLFLGLAAIVVDVGVLRRSTANLATSVDAAALAAGAQLPATSANATAITTSAVSYLNANYPGLGATSSWINYLCLVPLANGLPDGTQIPIICDPGSPAKTSLNCTAWRCGGGVATAPCIPSGTNICNVVVVGGAATSDYKFGPAIGVGSGSTGTVQSAACVGSCMGPPTVPVDLVIIVDRTLSMGADDIANVQLGANAVLKVYDPALQRVAMGTIGPSQTTTLNAPKLASCPNNSSPWKGTNVYGVNASSINFFGPAPTDLAKWMPLGFSGTDTTPGAPAVTFNEAYSSGGVVNTSSALGKAISCIVSVTMGTNLDTPIRMAANYLQTYGRPGVRKGIILETDGTPQAGDGSAHYTCDQANAAATYAKGLPDKITIYTIGYGVGDSSAKCPTKSGGTNNNAYETTVWAGVNTTTLLSSMASDPSKFFNAPASSAVEAAFRSAAQDLASGTRLISLP